MPPEEEKAKVFSIQEKPEKEKRIDLSLIILSSLLLIVLGSLAYLYLNVKSSQKKSEFFGQKPFTTTDVSLKKKKSLTSQNNDLVSYQDEQYQFQLSYPGSWGEATSRDVAGRKTIQLGSDSNFSVVVGPHFDPETGEPMKIKQLLAEGIIKEGCQQSEKLISNHLATIITCERTANSSIQAYLQEDKIIYILFYRFDATEMKTEEATTVFNLVSESFQLV